MGRKTYDEISHPLPNRVNVVISGSMLKEREDAFYDEQSRMYIYRSLDKFIRDYKNANSFLKLRNVQFGKDFRGKNLYGTGGRRIFDYFLKIADVIYATEIDHEYKGDTFFPFFKDNIKDSGERYEVIVTKDQDNIKITYTRKKYIRK